jgi:hypothetical protein
VKIGRILTSATLLASAYVVASSVPASAEEGRSYPVICVTRTIPTDPQPYEVCMFYPL